MKKKIFISFAEDNENLKNIFINQAKNDEWPYEFKFMDEKKPWSLTWKEKCKETVEECDGMIIIVTTSTRKDRGQVYEIKCANKDGLPSKGVYGSATSKPIRLSSKLSFASIIPWDWDKIRNWIINI